MCGWRSLRRRRGRLTRGDRGLASAAFFWVTEYISVSAVTASYGFALTATHFSRRRKVSKRLGPGVRPSLRLGFLRYGVHPGASPPVCFAAPPLDAFGYAKRSLRSHPRINPSTQPAEGAGTARSRAAAELTLILLSGEKHAVSLDCFAFLWKRACQRRRPMGRPISNRPHPIHLWELACQRWRPDSRPVSSCQHPITCGSWLASDGGPTANQSPATNTPFPLWERACSRRRPDSRPNLQLDTLNPPVGAGLPAMAA